MTCVDDTANADLQSNGGSRDPQLDSNHANVTVGLQFPTDHDDVDCKPGTNTPGLPEEPNPRGAVSKPLSTAQQQIVDYIRAARAERGGTPRIHGYPFDVTLTELLEQLYGFPTKPQRIPSAVLRMWARQRGEVWDQRPRYTRESIKESLDRGGCQPRIDVAAVGQDRYDVARQSTTRSLRRLVERGVLAFTGRAYLLNESWTDKPIAQELAEQSAASKARLDEAIASLTALRQEVTP